MTESRQDFLARVAEAHDAWVDEHEAEAPFNPDSRPASGDYNLWNLDMDADGTTQDAFFQAVGPADYVTDDAPDEEVNPDVGSN